MTISEFLFDNRIIFLSSNINEEQANFIITQLLVMNARDPQTPVDLYINSSGGNVFDALAIYDVMQIIQAPVATYCIGAAFSSQGRRLRYSGKRSPVRSKREFRRSTAPSLRRSSGGKQAYPSPCFLPNSP